MNPLILAVDTTREFGSLALLRGDELLEEMLIHAPDGFGGVLYEHLRRILERHGVGVNQIACFAAASGPGSFTGVRVGLACVQGLAEATGGKMVAVSSLEVLARFGTGALRAVVLDARRGEVYCALYNAQGEAVLPESVSAFPAWLDRLPEGEIEFVASDFAPFAAALASTRFANSKITIAPRALAGAIGRIALARFRAGLARDPASIEPNYVRRLRSRRRIVVWKFLYPPPKNIGKAAMPYTVKRAPSGGHGNGVMNRSRLWRLNYKAGDSWRWNAKEHCRCRCEP